MINPTKTDITLILPRYNHDCGICRFVGQLGPYDCYTCGDSVVMRFDDDGASYQSMPRQIATSGDYRLREYAEVVRMEQQIISNGGFGV